MHVTRWRGQRGVPVHELFKDPVLATLAPSPDTDTRDRTPTADMQNLSQTFLNENSVELCDTLAPYLRAGELGRLSTVCSAFSACANGTRRPKLGLTDEWAPLGHVGQDAALGKKTLMRLKPRVYSIFSNSDNNLVDHEVPCGSAVDPERTTLAVDLVHNQAGNVVEKLYSDLYWKGSTSSNGVKNAEPRLVKFMIREALSTYHTPVAQFRLRVTLSVARIGHDSHFTAYAYESPKFWVLTRGAIPKSGSAADLARKSTHRTHGRYV